MKITALASNLTYLSPVPTTLQAHVADNVNEKRSISAQFRFSGLSPTLGDSVTGTVRNVCWFTERGQCNYHFKLLARVYRKKRG